VDTWIWIITAVLAVVLVLVVVGRRAAVGRVDPTDLLLDPELVDQVRALARANQKPAAITLLRKHTPGLGLAPATVMVERMAASAARPPVPLSVPPELELRVRSLVSGGDTAEAIDAVRVHTGCDLPTAQAYVAGLDRTG
jgi:hypothetical protein